MRLPALPALLLAGALGLAACSEAPPEESAQDVFWANLQALCGQAFPGTPVEFPEGDTTFITRELIAHVRSCTADEIRIPFHVGEDRSRTWVLTRTADGIRLKHDHRHEDGSEDAVTQYGGETSDWAGYLARNTEAVRQEVGSPSGAGEAGKQEFPADAHTAEVIPDAVSNIWTVEVEPGRHYAYGLRRVGTDRRFRIEFDLTRPVAVPPAPWGSIDP
ncbi:MAG: hypothetical protein ABR551_02605 [Gemmatimonadales bacterium]